VLKRVRLKMDYIASILIQKEHLDREDFEQLMGEAVPDSFKPLDVKPATRFSPSPAG
jgi:hypothetical protein